MVALFPIGIEAEPESYGWISFGDSSNPVHFFPIGVETEPEPQGWISFEDAGANPVHFYPISIETEPEQQGWVDFVPAPPPQLVVSSIPYLFDAALMTDVPMAEVLNAPPALPAPPLPFMITTGIEDVSASPMAEVQSAPPPVPSLLQPFMITISVEEVSSSIVSMVLNAPNPLQVVVDPLPQMIVSFPDPVESALSSSVVFSLPEPAQAIDPLPQMVVSFPDLVEPMMSSSVVLFPMPAAPLQAGLSPTMIAYRPDLPEEAMAVVLFAKFDVPLPVGLSPTMIVHQPGPPEEAMAAVLFSMFDVPPVVVLPPTMVVYQPKQPEPFEEAMAAVLFAKFEVPPVVVLPFTTVVRSVFEPEPHYEQVMRLTGALPLVSNLYLKDYSPLPNTGFYSPKTHIFFTVASDGPVVDFSSLTFQVDITGTGTSYLVVFTGGAFQTTVDGTWTGQVFPTIDAPAIMVELIPPVQLSPGFSIFVRAFAQDITPTPLALSPTNPPPPVALGSVPIFYNPYYIVIAGSAATLPPYLDQRSPAPEAINIPIFQPVVFLIRDDDDGVDLTTVVIDVDATAQDGTALVRVWDSILGVQNGWGVVIQTMPNGRDYKFTLTPPVPFATAIYIVVRATNAADNGGLLVPVDLGPPSYAAYFASPSAQALVNRNPWRFLTQDIMPVVVDQAIVMKDGGYLIQLSAPQGQVPTGRYRLHLGPQGGVLDIDGNLVDPICYSGVSGQGNVVLVKDALDEDGVVIPGATHLSFVTPPYELTSADSIPPGPFDVFLENLDDGSTILLPDLVTVVPHEFRSDTMKLRKSLDPKWITGYRDPEEEDFPQ